MRNMLIATATIFLTACGGGGGDGGGADPRIARLDDYDAQRMRVLALPLTELSNLPDIGQGSFIGSATVRAETAPISTVLAGDASLSIDFSTGMTSGTIDRVFGTDADGVLQDYAGEIVISAGAIGDGAANAWTADYAGTLATPGQTLVFDGSVTGEFLGDTVAALIASDFEVGLTENGSSRDAVLTIVAEGSVN